MTKRGVRGVTFHRRKRKPRDCNPRAWWMALDFRSLFRGDRSDRKFDQLLGFHRAGGFGHEVGAALRLGERDHIPDRLAVEHEHDQAVESQRDAAVGGGAEAEGVEEEREFALGILRGNAQQAEDFALDFLLVDTDGAAADFDAVEHDIVRLGVDARGVDVEQRQILILGGGEGMVLGDVALRAGIVVEAGEVNDPEEVPLAFGDQLDLAAMFWRISPRTR